MMRRKEQLLEAILEQRGAGKEVTTTSRRLHVATSPSHDVGSTNAEVNHSPRRDVTTSRRDHVATLTRKSASHH